MFTLFTNPILGVLAGAGGHRRHPELFRLGGYSPGRSASTGAVTYAAAIPIIMGQNIGTCVTALLSALGANKNAKRAAMIHFYFNLIGSIFFIVVIYTLNAVIGFSFWNDPIDKAAIANFHTLFNVVVTILFIPFRGVLITLAEKTVKSKQSDNEISHDLSRSGRAFLLLPGRCSGTV